MSYAPLVALGLAAALSWSLMPLGIRIAWAVGWLDQPEARKLHAHATAVLGGAVVFASAGTAWGPPLTPLGRPPSPPGWGAGVLPPGAAPPPATGARAY